MCFRVQMSSHFSLPICFAERPLSVQTLANASQLIGPHEFVCGIRGIVSF